MRCFSSQCAASILFVLTVFSTAVSASAPPERLKVTATIFPLADIVRQVGGNRVHVVTLLRPGILPFSYQLGQIQIRQAIGTALYVRVGNGLDAWGDNLFSNAIAQPLTITITNLVDPLQRDNSAVLDDKKAFGQTGKVEPWVWLDPLFVRDRILPVISASLIRLRPGDARYFKVNERKYFEELTKLDQAMRSVLQQLPGRGFVATHAIWGSLATRYGLHQIARIEPSFADAPSELNQDSLAEAAQKLDIIAVFGDPWSKVSPSRMLAERLHGRFILLDPLGGEQLPGRHSYIALMYYNLSLIKNGMK